MKVKREAVLRRFETAAPAGMRAWEVDWERQ